MAGKLPDLDDLEHEGLLEIARTTISSTAGKWTDFNAHDPGITVVELLAWLTETYGYQLDQVTDAHRRKYLRLLGTAPRPPAPARAWVSLSPPEPMALSGGTRLRADDGAGAPEPFETDRLVHLTDARLASVRTVANGCRIDNTSANETDDLFYRAFGDDPTTGDTVCLGFDGDPFGSADALDLTVRFHDDDLPEPSEREDDSRFVPSVELAWEYCVDGNRVDTETAWEPLPVVFDETDCFYGTGTIRLGRPRDQDEAARASIEDSDSGLVWLRCRIVEAGYEIPPQFDAIETNLVPVSHGGSDGSVSLERADGSALALDGQQFAFPKQPVQSATIRVDGTVFETVPDFDRSDPNDAHCVLDRAKGSVTFGGGRHGRAPAADATVVATNVVYGGGKAGNVPANAAWRIDPEESLQAGVPLETVDVVPQGPATGGTAAESIDAAFRRVRADLQRPSRAVTTGDYERLATRTPGVRIARSAVVDDGRPGVTVVVVPYAPPDCRPAHPSEGLLDAVRRYLDERRLVTDRIRVRGPSYVRLDVTATVDPTPDGSEVDLADAVESALDASLDAHRPEPWPIGEDLSRGTLRERLAKVEGIESVERLSMRPRGDASVTDSGGITAGSYSLYVPGEMTIVREQSAARRPRP